MIPLCPKCSEPATHAEPLILNGQQKLWCANAHSWTAPVSPPPATAETTEAREYNA